MLGRVDGAHYFCPRRCLRQDRIDAIGSFTRRAKPILQVWAGDVVSCEPPAQFVEKLVEVRLCTSALAANTSTRLKMGGHACNCIRRCGFVKGVKVRASRDHDITTNSLRTCHAGVVSKTGHAPEAGYHFYRLDGIERWSHKDRDEPARDRDMDGHLITDPRLANRGDYKDFFGFWWVDHERSSEHFRSLEPAP